MNRVSGPQFAHLMFIGSLTEGGGFILITVA